MEHLTRAIVVDVVPKDKSLKEANKDLAEICRLVETYGGVVIIKIIQKRGRPSAKTFVGTGKAEEISKLITELNADVVIFNNLLKPNQIKHLDEMFNVEIWDRVDTILKIFEKHAHTSEAKLQIQLARFKHSFPKLYGKGIDLSQQAGIKGLRAGSGEKLLEVKKRHLRRLIKELESKLDIIRRVRAEQRSIYKKKNIPIIALVGYTNSGKSTLLKALTHKQNVRSANQLFTTLDTRLGHMWMKKRGSNVLIADTIGFIKNMPLFLIESFYATLEVVREADMLLHVIDITDSDIEEKILVVEEVLRNLEVSNKPEIYVFNKIDKWRKADGCAPLRSRYKKFNPIFISAEKGTGVKKLGKIIEDKLIEKSVPRFVTGVVAGARVEPATNGL